MEQHNNRVLINLLLGFAICSLILRAGLLAFGLHFLHVEVDLIGFALFWAVIATFVHLLLVERRHRIINALCWTVLLILYLPLAAFVQQFSDRATVHELQNYPYEIIEEAHPYYGGVPYATYSEAETYFGGVIYRKLESVDVTEDDLRSRFPEKYEHIRPDMNYFVWESKRLLFNFEDGKVYPAVRK